MFDSVHLKPAIDVDNLARNEPGQWWDEEVDTVRNFLWGTKTVDGNFFQEHGALLSLDIFCTKSRWGGQYANNWDMDTALQDEPIAVR